MLDLLRSKSLTYWYCETFTDGVCRRKNSQMKGIHCSHEAKNISRAGDNVRRSAFIKRRRLGRGISLFQSLVLYVQSRCCNRDVCRIALNPLSLSIFFAVESYHSDGEGGLNIGHSFTVDPPCMLFLLRITGVFLIKVVTREKASSYHPISYHINAHVQQCYACALIWESQLLKG